MKIKNKEIFEMEINEEELTDLRVALFMCLDNILISDSYKIRISKILKELGELK